MPKLIGWSVLGAVIVFLLWAGSAAILCQYVPESTARGTFGDMFGAINALFSGWAFLGVVIAIILQRQELEMQRQEIRESRIAQQASANAPRKRHTSAIWPRKWMCRFPRSAQASSP